jgi:hypothetical protein
MVLRRFSAATAVKNGSGQVLMQIRANPGQIP